MKYAVLKLLLEKEQEFVSGESLSGELGVSRTAIWKHINELKDEGYIIESVSRKGYKLLRSPDTLNSFEIGRNLRTGIIGRKILCLDVVDSTSTFAKKLAAEGCPDGTVVVSDIQTAGRGRLGRQWCSSPGKGVWMSIVLKPSIGPEDAQVGTLAASVAVVAALDKAYGIRAGIKWPNDVILNGRKLCGILTEMSMETERLYYLVLGIGINVFQEPDEFPDDLRDRVISLKMHACMENLKVPYFKRSDIIASVLNEFERLYKCINADEAAGIIEEWRKYSITLGREVRVSHKNLDYTGTAEDVTDDGRLVVRCSDGITREILSGEVSVRGLLGYV
jgi:BirA family biotin operon repressor/biotin-[acetyl-CoA-carboxylase] ligase